MSFPRIDTTRVLLVASMMLWACSTPTDATDDVEPSFEARVSGGVNQTVRGAARYSADVVGDEYGFGIVLVEPVATSAPDQARHAIYLYRAQPDGPAAGEFRVIESRDIPDARTTDFVGDIVINANENNGLACRADAGAVHLTPHANGRLSGTFTISARCERMNAPGTDDPIEITGSFSAEPGVVAFPDVAAPAMGSYALAEVGGQTLPGIVSVGVDAGHWLEVIATSGRVAIDATGHYEQLVMLESRSDGVLTGRWRWVDRGACRAGSGVNLVCTSEYLQNVGFGALLSASGIEVVQDIVGEGVDVRFRYRRAGPP